MTIAEILSIETALTGSSTALQEGENMSVSYCSEGVTRRTTGWLRLGVKLDLTGR